jgi:F-type H+-transporting ATPase subunit alpha
MRDFQLYLDKTQEVGYVEQTFQTLAYVKGLPGAMTYEVVVFETGEVGLILSLSPEYVEIIILSKTKVHVGTKVVRTGNQLTIGISGNILGSTVDSLGIPIGKSALFSKDISIQPDAKKDAALGREYRPIDITPPGIDVRKNISRPFETGVTMVDLVVPLGCGQRELVIGDRKTGKTGFLLQNVLTQARHGVVCVYGAIAKKRLDIKLIQEFFEKNNIMGNCVLVATSSSDPSGLVFLTPYTAMTIAEYFRDLGRDTLVILDDMTAHAKYYREITLLAKRFPGRSSYPGDIFYVHARLMERAGNFLVKTDSKSEIKEVSITCLPVAELVLSDLSGFIQTNLMAMTDGHIYFDIDLFNQGRRPPVNPFLSVTRVGRQAQTPLLRDLSRQLTSFLLHLEDLRQFMHFGAELSEKTRRELSMGDRLTAFFDQSTDTIVPMNINVIILSCLWGGYFRDYETTQMKRDLEFIVSNYQKDEKYKQKIDNLVRNINTFTELVDFVKQDDSVLMGLGRKNG